jgi:hypothetical protein
MNELSVKIHPSDLPHNEKKRRLREVLEFLLRSGKERNQKERGKAENEKMADGSQKGHAFTVSYVP